MWTGGQASKIQNILMATLCISFFKCALWTRGCLSISFFLSTLYPSVFSKSVDRRTSSENSEELMAIACVLLFKCVEMWARSCFFYSILFCSFYLVPFKSFFAQSVDRWTNYDNSENFNGNHMFSLFKSISCFLSFLSSLNFLQKVWTSGRDLKKNQPFVFHY